MTISSQTTPRTFTEQEVAEALGNLAFYDMAQSVQTKEEAEQLLALAYVEASRDMPEHLQGHTLEDFREFMGQELLQVAKGETMAEWQADVKRLFDLYSIKTKPDVTIFVMDHIFGLGVRQMGWLREEIINRFGTVDVRNLSVDVQSTDTLQ